MHGGYHWAGPAWQKHDASKVMSAIVGAELQSADPDALANRWSELLQRKVQRAGAGATPEIMLDHGFVRFVPMRDDRGEGLCAVHLKCRDTAHVMRAAKQAGLPSGADHVDLCGVRFVLVV